MSYCFCRAFVPKCKPIKTLCCMYISVRIPYIREKCKVSSSLRHTYMSSLFVLARCVKILSSTEVVTDDSNWLHLTLSVNRLPHPTVYILCLLSRFVLPFFELVLTRRCTHHLASVSDSDIFVFNTSLWQIQIFKFDGEIVPYILVHRPFALWTRYIV
jgi:hypothetical protein